jgi:hypothetical protein
MLVACDQADDGARVPGWSNDEANESSDLLTFTFSRSDQALPYGKVVRYSSLQKDEQSPSGLVNLTANIGPAALGGVGHARRKVDTHRHLQGRLHKERRLDAGLDVHIFLIRYHERVRNAKEVRHRGARAPMGVAKCPARLAWQAVYGYVQTRLEIEWGMISMKLEVDAAARQCLCSRPGSFAEALVSPVTRQA